MEIWKEINWVDGKFAISNQGLVKNLITNKIHYGSNLRGYKSINLKNNGKIKNYLIHRIVAKAFMDNYDDKLMINHIDFNKSNNKIDNLELVTNRENQCHSIKAKNKFIGVSYHKIYKVWTAQIMINGKLKYLGRYQTQEDAYNARCKFELDNGIVNKYL
jgi:hypothetical protein